MSFPDHWTSPFTGDRGVGDSSGLSCLENYWQESAFWRSHLLSAEQANLFVVGPAGFIQPQTFFNAGRARMVRGAERGQGLPRGGGGAIKVTVMQRTYNH